jgi:RHS repeat-associated protein
MDYYPFGSLARSEGSAGGNYRYGYQGAYAEKDAETDWNSFELRMYDARVGRWLGVDPYGQYSSPYVGMGNNPANRTDPDGGIDLPEIVVHAQRLGSYSAVARGVTLISTTFNVGMRHSIDFANGMAHAWAEDQVGGLVTFPHQAASPTARDLGRKVGHSIALLQGVGEFVLGATGSVGGGLLTATGVGAVLGVPAMGVSVAAIAHSGVVLHGSIKGLTNDNGIVYANSSGKFKGGKKSGRDRDFGIKDKDFWNWWHRSGKKANGGVDLSEDLAAETYKDWLEAGRPKVK